MIEVSTMAVIDPNIFLDHQKTFMLLGLSFEVSLSMIFFTGTSIQESFCVSALIIFFTYLILVILHAVNAIVDRERLQSERYKNLIEQLHANFIITDENMNIKFTNKPFLNYSPDELIGKNMKDLPLYDQEKFETLKKTRTIEKYKCQCKSENGDIRHYLVDSRIQNVNGNSFEISIFIRDVSSEDQERSAALRAKNEFIASISHEIRNPLQVILYNVENLLAQPLEKMIEEPMKDILMSTKLLTTIIGDILDYSKIEAGEMTLIKTKFELLDVVESSIIMNSPCCLRKGLKLTLYFDFSLPKFVIGDCSRILQIMNNYLSNAIKYTDGGKITIHANRIKYKDHQEFYYECQDTGVGIASDDMNMLFDPFIQLETSTAPTNFKGWGLGLSICKKLVNLMKGRYGVKRNHENGSSFWFTIPLESNSEGTLEEEMKKTKWVHTEISVHHSDPEILSTIKSFLATSPILIRKFDRDHLQPNQILFIESHLLDDVPKSFNKDQIVVVQGSDYMTFKTLRYPILPSSLFKILLEGNSDPVVHPKEIENKSYDKLKILVVDDNKMILRALERLLKKIGVVFIEMAEDGLEAYEKVCKMSPFDLIFMDISMPVMDGIESTRLVRSLGTEKSKCSIVALTGNALLKTKEELCKEWQMDEIISKPVNMNDLLSSLKNFQNKKI